MGPSVAGYIVDVLYFLGRRPLDPPAEIGALGLHPLVLVKRSGARLTDQRSFDGSYNLMQKAVVWGYCCCCPDQFLRQKATDQVNSNGKI